MYQAYVVASGLNPAPESSDDGPSNVKVLAEFPSTYCLIPTSQKCVPFKLNITIKPMGSRVLVINRKTPVIPLLQANDKSIPHGLPRLSVWDTEKNTQTPAFSLQLDLFYREDLEKRLNILESPDPIPSENFEFMDSGKMYPFTYIINAPDDYVASRVYFKIMQPSRSYEIRVGAPGQPSNEGHWYQNHITSVETVPVELEQTQSGIFHLTD